MKHLPAAAAFTAIIAVSAVAIAAQDNARPDTAPLPERFAYSEPASVSQPSGPTASLNLCGEREQMVQDLDREFREQPLASGLVDQDAVMEIFVSPGGTWTILATGTDGLSCVMAVGEGFDAAPPRITGVGA
ncbi:hypothetical protein EJC49_00505 [Aquibium carbonis]|uniref:Uncharacterized protein n=1 Tax=Aquibium carbonis TaxID=2495581 RepID=A0A3R9YVL8_9HYPH|nr:hypothetical protein [Aquibium carbonis]RST88217.1 hypothetical protein EJC49_00505 [Aquibium carbonis]